MGGRAMEEGSSRTGRWIKEIFKKQKEEGGVEQNEVSDEAPTTGNGHKTMELADISEEDEEDKDNRANGNGVIPHQQEEKEMESDENNGEAEKNGSEAASDTKEDTHEEDDNAANEKHEEDENAANEKLEGKDAEARMQDGLVTYMAKEKEADNEKSINGVMRVFGSFMKKIKPEPEEANGQPPSYSEAVQESSDAEPPKNEEEENPVKETREASTQMDLGTQVDLL